MSTLRCPKVRVPFVTLRNLHVSHRLFWKFQNNERLFPYISLTNVFIMGLGIRKLIFLHFRRISSFKGKILLYSDLSSYILPSVQFSNFSVLASTAGKHISFICVLCTQYFKYITTSATYQTIKRRVSFTLLHFPLQRVWCISSTLEYETWPHILYAG